MTTTRFTKEQLIAKLQHRLTVAAKYPDVEEAELDAAIFQIALASLTAEPALYAAEETLAYANMGELHLTCLSEPMGDAVIPLYTAPPVPVVPEEMTMADAIMEIDAKDADRWTGRIGFKKGWNACRDAMLHGKSEPVSNRDELPEEKGSSLQLRNLIRQRHAEWSEKTFGNVGPVGPLKHLSKEALEAADEPDDLSEWADMQFLLWDAQRRAGISDGEITAAMEEKLKVNMARQWPEPKDGEPRLHIKEQSESVFPEVECDICGHVSTDPEGRHYCCEDNSND